MVWQVHAEFAAASAIPADKTVNTFHFLPGLTADVNDVFDAIEGFYKDPRGGGIQVTTYMSVLLSGAYVLKAYDLDEAPPRVPFAMRSGSYTEEATSALPRECAICVSYHATIGSGDVAARRRGRIFIGPLSVSALQSTGGSAGQVEGGYQDVLRDAAEAFMGEAAAADAPWAVFSRADDAAREVVGGWVDNAFDTQRRRGELATNRLLWGV